MSRAYLRKDPGFFERKAIEQDYPAGAYVALDGVLCLAEAQPQRGRFRDVRLLRALLGRYGRWVPTLVEKGDLVELPDGRLYVEGWDEWQEGDWKVGERVARIRQRKRGETPAVTVETVTSNVTDRHVRESRPAIAQPLTAEEGVQGEKPILRLPVKNMDGTVTEVEPTSDLPPDTDRFLRLCEELTGRAYALGDPYAKLGQKALEDHLRPHRWARTERAYRQVAARLGAEAGVKPTIRQLVLGADDLLNPIPQGLDREAHEAEEQRRYDRRVENTQRRLREMETA